MAYTGLTVTDEVYNTAKSSHTIPAYPEYTSKTVFDEAFYQDRQEECDRLMGAAIDYHEDVEGPGTPENPGTAVDISDAAISGPTSIIDSGPRYSYILTGTNSEQYTDDYTIQWSGTTGYPNAWDYASDTSDVIGVQVYGTGEPGSEAGRITCTLTERGNTLNSTTLTFDITVS